MPDSLTRPASRSTSLATSSWPKRPTRSCARLTPCGQRAAPGVRWGPWRVRARGVARTGPVTVTTAGGTGASPAPFTVVLPPAISGFTPTHGQVGTDVTIGGVNLVADTGTTSVTFAGSGGTRLPALVETATATAVVAKVPN